MEGPIDKNRLTKLESLLPIPGTPVVIHDLMPHSVTYLPCAEGKRIDMGPVGLNALSICSSHIWQVIEQVL